MNIPAGSVKTFFGLEIGRVEIDAYDTVMLVRI
jgi:hypothetical protein